MSFKLVPPSVAGGVNIAASNTTYTSGTAVFTGVGGGITVSSNTGQRVDLSVAAPIASSDTGSLIPLGNTTGTTASIALSGQVALAGGNRITLSGHSDSASRVTISAANDVGSLIPLGNTTGTTASIPVSTNFAIAGGNNITISGHSDSSSRVTISAAAQTVQSQNMVALSASNTLYSSGTVLLTGSNMITVKSSGAGQTVILDATQTNQTQSNIQSIAASNTTYNTGLVVFTGSNAASVKSSGAGQTAIIDVPLQTGSLVPLGNTTGTTASITMSANWALAGGNNITLSAHSDSASRLTVSAPNTTSETWWNARLWENQPDVGLVGLSSIQAISKTPFYFPISVNGNLTMNSVGVRLAAVSSVASSVIQSFSIHMGIYTLVNSTSAALAGSASDSFNLSAASSASYLTGRNFVMTSPSTKAGMSNLTPGNYIMGLMFSGAASQSHAFSVVGATPNATSLAPSGAVHPGANSFSTATSQGLQGFLGQGSSTVAAMPANVSVGDLRNQGTATQPMLPYVFIRS